ncbi:hypothetical protein NADFUDRAFT_52665 [Nadsonia fulvescens var. elongata DSM 6958]|uniref:WKF domain-containing protein n=1 Tax=Nadsonia fulvescens var. elongata DSM 6958 TaxID=857566 RepID=A0A1E3PG08_9ASCO|nr:hypothetical protein NADFUDRAFT_52665 [Nadsonia fulvescens var. elongata DSM 6958]
MSQHVPAWKRLGLKVTETAHDDPLALINTLPTTADAVLPGHKRKLPNQKTPKREKATKRAIADDSLPKKAPKRVKVPKSDRAPPPESDQLAYLRMYHEDRANWKFSKQKQNWILKNLYTVDLEKYQDSLVAYLQGLQGGSKFRLVEECKAVMEAFKKFMEEDDEDDDDKPKSILKNTETTTEGTDRSDIPTEDKARRAQLLYKGLTGNDFDLGLDDLDNGEAEANLSSAEESPVTEPKE